MKRKHILYQPLKNILALFCCVMMMQQAAAQVPSAKADRNRILLGEPIQLLLEAPATNNNAALEKFFNPDSIAHFDIIEKNKIDTLSGAFRRTITITSFDSGRWAIPAFKLGVQTTDSIVVDVGTVPMDYNKDYHDIKNIIEVSGLDAKWIYMGIGVLALLSLIAVIYFVRRSQLARKVVQEPQIAPATLLSETLKALQQLQAENLPGQGLAKEYYVRLGDIFRNYVWKRSGIRTMEKTSGELLSQLKSQYTDANVFTQLAAALRMGDAVKFAKYIPAEEDNRQSFEAVREAVEKLSVGG